jgi:hypothetical protein
MGKTRTAGVDVGRDPRPAARRAHPFYTRLNQLLDEHDFDGYVEGLCQGFYAGNGRPGLVPDRYFRLLLIGYFEGLDAERAIAWRRSRGINGHARLCHLRGYGPTATASKRSSPTRAIAAIRYGGPRSGRGAQLYLENNRGRRE